jgi:hypothetical protein
VRTEDLIVTLAHKSGPWTPLAPVRTRVLRWLLLAAGLGGYFMVEARDLNDAIKIAEKIPGARKGTVEVRPVMELAGLPEERK